ncbi:hedgehog-type HINT domain protein [Cryptosporidium ryanae]|uniref:hedgehog-type HINT domain protein n=1 Tax=Cryptosporidium ryanae TaxID=515981 RepID=UPI00351A7071|nr:hedgehog-type HINT domain protein [Cryptosporidium ryanae]
MIRIISVILFGIIINNEHNLYERNLLNEENFLRLRTKSIFDSFSMASTGPGSFRSGWGNVISNAISLTFPSSCIGQLLNIGYVSNEYDEDDYPYNPICGAQSQSNNLCFPGVSKVISRDKGEIMMKDLEVGEYILTRDLKTMEFKYSVVELMLHKDENMYIEDEWVVVEYLGMKKPLIISPDHFVFIRMLGNEPHEGNCQIESLINIITGTYSTYIYTNKQEIESIVARNLREGHSIIVSDSKYNISWITEVRIINKHNNTGYGENTYFGRFAPLTSSGYLIVDGVLVSSYSKPYPWSFELINPTHKIVNFIIKPFIFIENNFKSLISKSRSHIEFLIKYLFHIFHFKKYLFDHTTPLSLEIIRAITSLIL